MMATLERSLLHVEGTDDFHGRSAVRISHSRTILWS